MWYDKTMSYTYIYDVVPFTVLPLHREPVLWYGGEERLPNGTVVRIPLFRRSVTGVVQRTRTSRITRGSTVRIRPITQVIHREYFTPSQCALIESVAALYYAPLGTVYAQAFVPPTARRASRAESQENITDAPTDSLAVSERAKEIFSHRAFSYHLLRDTGDKERLAVIATAAQHARTAQQTLLLLVPEILLATVRTQWLRTHGFRTACIHNKVAAGTLWHIWNGIRDGAYDVVIGTKKALFAPYTNLHGIIIDEEHAIGFKQWDRTPRMDARTVATFISKRHRVPLCALSTAPRITRTVPSPLGPPHTRSTITLVDMRAVYREALRRRNTRRPPRAALFAPETVTQIQETVKRGHQVIVFFHHKGKSAFSLCQQCGTLLVCPHCDRALVMTPQDTYECNHCTFHTDVFARCANCEGMQFRNIGYGTARIEQFLHRHVPDANITRIDGHSMRGTHAAQDALRALESADIIVGTQMALRPWHRTRCALVVIVDADALLSRPDVFADEHLYATIANAAAITHRHHGTVVVQTYKPDYYVFPLVRDGRYDAFRKHLLRARRMRSYPPYCRMIRLVIRHANEERCQTLACDVHRQLRDGSDDLSTPIRISDVYTPLIPKVRGLHHRQILIRIGRSDTTPIPSALHDILCTLPPRTIIDVDPISIV